MKLKNKIISPALLTAVLFLAFIVTAGGITLLRDAGSYSYYENRNLASFPEYTSEGVDDGSWFSALESHYTDRAAGRKIILRLKTIVDEYILCRPVVNDIIATDELLLPWHDYSYETEEKTAERAEWYADKLGQLSDLVESYGGYYCYVGVPCQFNIYSDEYPAYLENSAEISDMTRRLFAEYANEYGVDFLDVGDILKNAEDPALLSSTTDNHYSLIGAYEAYKAVIDFVNERGGYSLSYPVENEITFKPLENRYIGAWERKLFSLTRVHDTLYTAEFSENIPFTRTDSGIENLPVVYSIPNNTSESVFYTLYMGGDCPNTVIDTNRSDLPDALISGDSFTNAIECLAYYSFDTMTSIDLRHYNEMTLAEYIEKYQPDIVIGVRDYEDLITPYFNGDVFGLLR